MSSANLLTSGVPTAPSITSQYASGGSGSGVSSITAGNSTIQIGGTASVPTISSFAGSSTSDPVIFTATPLTASTAVSFGSFPTTSQVVNPGEYWLVSGQGSMQSTATNPANTMGIYLDFTGTTTIWRIFDEPESTTTFNGCFGFVVKVPSGVSDFDIKVVGSTGSGTITGGLQALNYTKLNLV